MTEVNSCYIIIVRTRGANIIAKFWREVYETLTYDSGRWPYFVFCGRCRHNGRRHRNDQYGGRFQKSRDTIGSLKCSALVSLVPNNLSAAISSLSLGSVLSALGEENASAQGVIATGGATFTCIATVQYRWQIINLTGVQMAIVYTVAATDPGGTNPGKDRQR